MKPISHFLALAVLAAVTVTRLHAADLVKAKDGSGVYGYKDTHKLPWCDWLVHDPDRPAPPKVDPGPAPAPVPVPADAGYYQVASVTVSHSPTLTQ
jgi:hypothetical protein